MTMSLIQTVTLPSTTNAISFSTIPGTYKDLYLIFSVRGTDAATRVPFIMTFNNNSSSYSGVRGYAFEGGLGADSGTSYTYIPLSSINSAGVSANIFSPKKFIFLIMLQILQKQQNLCIWHLIHLLHLLF